MSTYPPLPDFSEMDDITLVQFAGEALFGAHWRRYLPERLGVSESYLDALSRKKEARTLTANMRRKLLDLCVTEPARVLEMARWQVEVMRQIQVEMESRSLGDE